MSEADRLEIWKDIADYNGYQVSNLGNVRSKNRTIMRKNGIKQTFKAKNLSPCKNNKGYYMVSLKGKQHTVHRLVAKAFVDNSYNQNVVNHINGIKTDNRAENLEFTTQQDNMQKAWRNNQCENVRKSLFSRTHKREIKTSRAVYQYDLEGNLINTFVSTREATDKTGISNCLIVANCKGRLKTTHNYIFKYVGEEI